MTNKGNLSFVNVKAKKLKTKGYAQFIYNDEEHSSEGVGTTYYKSLGYNARFTENNFWNDLLLILFNNELRIKPNIKATPQVFIEYPYDSDYYDANKDKINKRIEYLKNIDLNNLLESNNEKETYGPLFKHLNNEQILSIMEHLLKDYIHNKKGFPDLLIYNDSKLFFSEVKSINDTLMRHQVETLKFFLNLGIDIELFTINKNKEGIQYEKEKFKTNHYNPLKTDLDKYQNKIKIGNKVFESLQEETNEINKIKNKIIFETSVDYFIGYLNVLNNYNLDKQLQLINNYEKFNYIKKLAKKEEFKIHKYKIMAEGRKFEDKRDYKKAIEIYKKLQNNPEKALAYKRICICYRKDHNYKDEIEFIYKCIHDNSLDKYEKRYFKRRSEKFIKSKNSILTETDIKCPKCGEKVNLIKLTKRNNVKYLACIKDKCYWYGGFYTKNLKNKIRNH